MAPRKARKKREIFFVINFANFWIYGLSTLAILLFINDFITLWLGQKFILPFSIVSVIALNFYMVGMQNVVWTYRYTSGLFHNGRWIILITALLNLIFSFVLGSYFGLVGILLSLTFARLFTNSWFDPYIVFKKALQLNPLIFFKRYLYYFLFLIFIAFLSYLMYQYFNYLNRCVNNYNIKS